MQIRESAEDYLEAILRLSQKGGGVRSVDIATMLSVSKPQCQPCHEASQRRRLYCYGPLWNRDSSGQRRRDCNRIYERHTVLTTMLESLGVPSEIARADACKMEHDISDESFARIKERLIENGQLD